MQHYPFVVDETPYCLWDWDLKRETLVYLDSLDPTYFAAVGLLLAPGLELPQKNQAALGIRLAYFQALESFFALLAATVQAPHAPLGWLVKYKNIELRSLIEKIESGQPVKTRLTARATWEELSAAINGFQLDDPHREDEIRQGFARVWGRCAREFVSDRAGSEYNSIKHGLRVHSSGFSVSVGIEKKPGVPAPKEKMTEIGASEFGSTNYWGEPVGKGRLNIRTRSVSRPWDPYALVVRLQLLAMSINNVIGSLRILSGRPPTEVRFEWPSELETFDRPWEPSASIGDLQINSSIAPDDISPMSREGVLDSYETTQDQDV